MDNKTDYSHLLPDKEEVDNLIKEFRKRDSMPDGRPLCEVMRAAGDRRPQIPRSSDFVVKSALERLMALEGLDEVKNSIESQLNYAKIMKIREGLGFRAPRRIFHFILTGNPGTGKTTVARLIGEIFHEAGLLRRGHTVETDRAALVGHYIGETESNTTEKINEARGGVLFIDEIYSLTSEASDSASETRDYGFKVIDTLIPVLSNPEADLIIIGAGYKENMARFLKANPGLASRFSMVMDFEDLSVDQLLSISRNKLREYDFSLSEEGEMSLRILLNKAVRIPNFGNGRFAVTLVENHILPKLCGRLMKKWSAGTNSASRMRKLSVVKPEDIPAIETLFPLSKRVRAVAGFRLAQ